MDIYSKPKRENSCPECFALTGENARLRDHNHHVTASLDNLAHIERERDALEAKLAALEKEIAEAPHIYGRLEDKEGDEFYYFTRIRCRGDTHRARLVRIEELPK